MVHNGNTHAIKRKQHPPRVEQVDAALQPGRRCLYSSNWQRASRHHSPRVEQVHAALELCPNRVQLVHRRLHLLVQLH